MDTITAITLAEEAKIHGYLHKYPQAVILLAELYLASLGKRERAKIEKQVKQLLEETDHDKQSYSRPSY